MRRICIVTPADPTASERGDIGAHARDLALALAAQPGNMVTLVSMAHATARATRDWLAQLARHGVHGVPLDALPTAPQPRTGPGRQVELAHRVHDYLRDQAFDVIHFQDWLGAGFIAMQAKRCGLAFADTLLTLTMHGPSTWVRDRAGRWPDDPVQAVKVAYAERYCCAHADMVLAMDAALFTWAERQGWALQPGHRVMPRPGADAAAWVAVSQTPPPRPPATGTPPVTVCVPYFNHGRYLPQLLAALATEAYPALEVVVVNDGSTDPQAEAVFEAEARRHAGAGFRFLRQPNGGLGHARNVAAAQATGDYLIFVDADNVPKPGMVSTFVSAMQLTGVDALTCHFQAFHGDEAPSAATPAAYAFTPIGPCLELGVLENCFGDANMCVRRSVFEALGGFTTERDTGYEDWEFLATLALKGYSQDIVPAALLWYRHLETSMNRTLDTTRSHKRALRAYQAALPPHMYRLIAELTVPLHLRAQWSLPSHGVVGRLTRGALAWYRALRRR